MKSQNSIKYAAIGIRTAPRDPPTLGQTIAGLRGANFRQPPHIFAPRDWEYPGTLRSHHAHQLPEDVHGNWPALRYSISHLVENVRAAWYLILEDDVLLAQNCADYLDWTLPINKWNSLFCSSDVDDMLAIGDDNKQRKGWINIEYPTGSLAYLISDELAQQFCADVDFEKDRLWQADEAVGMWCRANSVVYREHLPSLSLHIGLNSSIQDRPISQSRQCKKWVHSCNPWFTLDIEGLYSSDLSPAAFDVSGAQDRVQIQVYGPDNKLKQQSASLMEDI